MSGIGVFLLGQEQQQQSIYSSIGTNVLSLSTVKMLGINQPNITNENFNNSNNYSGETQLTYKISLGFICVCLCLLTITGNLLVLITFRRIRTVSIRIINVMNT